MRGKELEKVKQNVFGFGIVFAELSCFPAQCDGLRHDDGRLWDTAEVQELVETSLHVGALLV